MASMVRDGGAWAPGLCLAVLLLFVSPTWAHGRQRAVDPGSGDLLPGDSLTLQEVLAQVRERSPRLREAGFWTEAAIAREAGAGVLPDPMLELGAMNLSFPGLSPDMPASMAPTFQLAQRIPLPSKLSLARGVARLETLEMRKIQEETWWEVRAAASGAFWELYRVDRQRDALEEALRWTREMEAAARALYASGAGRQADVLRAGVEVARREGEILTLGALRTAAAARLNALLDRGADAPLPSPVSPPRGAGLPEPATLLAWAGESRPLLARLRAQVERSHSLRELAHREIWPDLAVGVQFGLGRMEGELRSMGGAMVGVTLPIHAHRRQLRARDEARAQEEAARMGLEGAMAATDARILQLSAMLRETSAVLSLYQEEILPQARAAVESSLSSYRVGTSDFTSLLEAQRTVYEMEATLFQLQASYGSALGELESTVGRALGGAGDESSEAS